MTIDEPERNLTMLVLSRKPGERFHIGDNITITLVRVGPSTARLGIDAPRDLNVWREELEVDDVLTPSFTPGEQTDA